MNKLFCLFCLFTFSQFIYSQNPKTQKRIDKISKQIDTSQINRQQNSKGKTKKNKDAVISDYKIISHLRDTTFVDTTLSIQKEYKYNYLRKDNFNLIAFSNLGQTYNTLSSNYHNTGTMPLFGSRARHFNYMEIEDINYYHVPTPLTELMYKTAFEQGQLLDAFFTTNLSRQINFSIAYKGLRSLGKYQHILTSTGNFRFTTNYKTKNERYQARAHIVMQDILNEENGGLQDDDIINFESGTPEFEDRGVFDPNFENAEGVLKGKRFHLEHQYSLIKSNDSLAKSSITLGNIISLEDKNYRFEQTAINAFFGDAISSSNINDRVTLEHFYNQFSVNYNNKTLGNFNINLGYNNYNYGYNSLIILEGQEDIVNRLKGDIVSVGGTFKKQYKQIEFIANASINVSGDFDGNYIDLQGRYKVNDDLAFKAIFNSSSKAPNYNHLLYQSDYLNYNWNNSKTFKNISTQQLAFQMKSKQFANLFFDFTTINNYTYFAKENGATNSIKPLQSITKINYFRLKLNREIKFGKFALDNTIMYQNVLDGDQTINVPDIITRNTLYYSNHLFKKAMFLQTGITFNYFTKYHMNAYDPLLAEFYTQNTTELGGFPRLDFFINAKVRQTRIFLKAEHFNSSFTGFNYYSAPNYPYRDFIVRFGLVWNFFL